MSSMEQDVLHSLAEGRGITSYEHIGLLELCRNCQQTFACLGQALVWRGGPGGSGQSHSIVIMLHCIGNVLPMENKFKCICNKYGYGRPHPVSRSTWCQHIQEAGSEEERQKFNFIKKNNASGSQLPPGARRAATIRALAKQAQENSDDSRVGQRKWAKPGSTDADINYNFDDNNNLTGHPTYMISHVIRASRLWADDMYIPDGDGWAGRDIIPDKDGWAHLC
ncbi:hypothetical protein BDR03DRAFT_988318 [Suillus americanus]|nr:hypothetical protein BDR03DRAFT_988318 [Suillus americanus]